MQQIKKIEKIRKEGSAHILNRDHPMELELTTPPCPFKIHNDFLSCPIWGKTFRLITDLNWTYVLKMAKEGGK